MRDRDCTASSESAPVVITRKYCSQRCKVIHLHQLGILAINYFLNETIGNQQKQNTFLKFPSVSFLQFELVISEGF